MKHYFSDLFSLVFPKLCLVCKTQLLDCEEHICLSCQHQLPLTQFHAIKENPLEQLFWGKVEIEAATALYYYQKKSSLQQLLHHLKYKNKQALGKKLGRMLGEELKDTSFAEKIDCVIAVPLHRKRKRKRGYNQSELLAKGAADALELSYNFTSLRRTIANPTQTTKGTYARWENVAGIFEVVDKDQLKNKHVLLIDDVVTTGATLESCALSLQNIDGIKISIACIAIA